MTPVFSSLLMALSLAASPLTASSVTSPVLAPSTAQADLSQAQRQHTTDSGQGLVLAAAAPRQRAAGPRQGSSSSTIVRQQPFDRAVISWNALTPPGTWLRLELRARVAGRWTRAYPLALWSSDPVFRASSYGDTGDSDGKVNTDTLELNTLADALEIRVQFFSNTSANPSLTGLWATTAQNSQMYRLLPAPVTASSTWGQELAVPTLSQLQYPSGGPYKGGPVWCSPTSTTMILQYWQQKTGRTLADPVPQAARAIWDAQYSGSGNWPFNTAYASSKGLSAKIIRLGSLAEAEHYIAAGQPLALSLGWGKDELPGAYMVSTEGHIVVLRGFDASGNPIINDPAAPTLAQVRVVYPRAALERAWIAHSGGMAYDIRP
jgi:hypothetical protein